MDMQVEINKVPSTKSKLRAKFAFANQYIMPAFEREMGEGAKKGKVFAKKRKSGRPKTKKRKSRGRPKRRELGYEK